MILFFPKSAIPNWKCGLSTDAAYTWTFTVIGLPLGLVSLALRSLGLPPIFAIVTSSSVLGGRGLHIAHCHAGFLRGLFLGPILYLLYTSPLGDIVGRYSMGYHFYADTQLYLSFDSWGGDAEALAVSQVEACACEIDNWMYCNKLKLNSDKSELLDISSQYRPCPILSSLTIGCSVVQSSASARNLGVVFDNGLMFEKHISAICKSAFYHLRRIAKTSGTYQ